MRRGNKGFSLVELSIVLVILGLLVGGILVGQNLIKAAEMRSVTSELQTFQTAVNIFQEKYHGLPGDLKNAGDFWGYADTSGPDGGCGDPENDTGTGTETCDGNGSGKVGNLAAQQWEPIRFWQHLANAGLIEGSYNGVGTAPADSAINVNIPASKYSNAGWIANEIQNYSGDVDVFAIDYGNGFHLGAPIIGYGMPGAIFTPEELWNIDTKIDDGKPGRGKVIARWIQNCTTASDMNDLDAEYELQRLDVICSVYFAKAF